MRLAVVSSLAALAILCQVVPVQAQSTRSQLDNARQRATRVKSKVERIAEEYARQISALGQTDIRIGNTKSDIRRGQDEMASLRVKLRQRVRTAYRMGSIGFFQFLLEARSFRDFSLRYIALQRQSGEDENLILKLRRKHAELQARQDELRQQRSLHASQAAALRVQARRVTVSFREAQSLVNELKGRLKAEEIARLFRTGVRGRTGGLRIPLDSCPVGFPHFLSNDFGAPRGGGTRRHKGNDILAPRGTPILAPVSGTISRWRTGGLGGIAMYLWGSDHNEYYFAHNSRNIAPAGSHVSGGQTIATVGDTGNAAGGPTHLHFELHPGGGGAIDPYPSLAPVC